MDLVKQFSADEDAGGGGHEDLGDLRFFLRVKVKTGDQFNECGAPIRRVSETCGQAAVWSHPQLNCMPPAAKRFSSDCRAATRLAMKLGSKRMSLLTKSRNSPVAIVARLFHRWSQAILCPSGSQRAPQLSATAAESEELLSTMIILRAVGLTGEAWKTGPKMVGAVPVDDDDRNCGVGSHARKTQSTR